MAAQTPGNRNSYVYVGLAGETAPGRRVNSGLYRMADGDEEWTLLETGLPQAPAIRALTIHPENPDIVYAGTQDGPYVSTDHGDHWEKVNAPDHGLPVWSIMFDPRDSDVLYAGYESCQICRSGDRGESWSQLPVSVRFPDVTLGPGSNPAKRVLMMAGSLSNAGEMYAAIEVGGLIRTLDGGDHWENLSHGQYVNDDEVDMHGVLASTLRPGAVFGIGRAGLFSSQDRGRTLVLCQPGSHEPQGTDLLPQHPGNPRRPQHPMDSSRRQLPKRERRAVPQRRWRPDLGPSGHRSGAPEHHVRCSPGSGQPQQNVLRRQPGGGLGQP